MAASSTTRSSSPRSDLGACLIAALVLVGALRVADQLVGSASVQLFARDWSALAGRPETAGVLVPPDDPRWAIVAPWQRFDALEYEAIAANGYGHRQRDAAFAPLFPLLMRATGAVVGDLTIAGLIVATAGLVVALALLRWLVAADVSDGVARRATVLLALSPTAFFLVAPYAESLFLALVVATFVAMRARRPLVAAVVSALAVWCRPQGILAAIPLAVRCVARDLTPRERAYAIGALALPVASLAGYVLWLRSLGWSGPLEVQETFWSSRFGVPLETLARSWDEVTRRGLERPHAVLDLLAVAATLAAGVACLRLRLPIDHAAYCLATGAAMLSRLSSFTPLQSADRFVLAAFPVFVVLAIALRGRSAERVVSVVFAAGHAIFFARFALYLFVG